MVRSSLFLTLLLSHLEQRIALGAGFDVRDVGDFHGCLSFIRADCAAMERRLAGAPAEQVESADGKIVSLAEWVRARPGGEA